jgi:hypothetical protein
MKPYGVKREQMGQCKKCQGRTKCDTDCLVGAPKKARRLVKSRERRKNKVDTRSDINKFREDVVNNLTYEMKFW